MEKVEDFTENVCRAGGGRRSLWDRTPDRWRSLKNWY